VIVSLKEYLKNIGIIAKKENVDFDYLLSLKALFQFIKNVY